MTSAAFGETIQLVRPPAVDVRTGDPAAGTATEVDIHGVVAWPSDSNGAGGNERTFRQDTVLRGYTLLLPPGTDIRTTDQVRLFGELWEVDGEPARWRSQLTGREPGIQVALRRGTG